MPEFTVDTASDAEGLHVVTPRGELDVATHRHLRESIHELVLAGKVHIVVDLNHTTFLDSTALGTLISARRRTHALKGSFAIRCDDERLLQVFRVTSLDRVFTIIRSA
ncbi:STAS domain-containing protein [Nocardioides houyundeii]|uniref:STAS domain-containing protein n=1 Tax=Nocardioides houyundeii TaxID=2045452 RepID=UPI0018F024AC|nr:STAS domain-containing protein [Nocardioides houyundeii]